MPEFEMLPIDEHNSWFLRDSVPMMASTTDEITGQTFEVTYYDGDVITIEERHGEADEREYNNNYAALSPPEQELLLSIIEGVKSDGFDELSIYPGEHDIKAMYDPSTDTLKVDFGRDGYDDERVRLGPEHRDIVRSFINYVRPTVSTMHRFRAIECSPNESNE